MVNNAGIQRTVSLAEATQQVWDDIIAVNLSGAFHTCGVHCPEWASADGRLRAGRQRKQLETPAASSKRRCARGMPGRVQGIDFTCEVFSLTEIADLLKSRSTRLDFLLPSALRGLVRASADVRRAARIHVAQGGCGYEDLRLRSPMAVQHRL